MPLDLANYREQARDAIKAFWGNRQTAIKGQVQSSKTSGGPQGAGTTSQSLEGFRSLILSLVHANGLEQAQVHTNSGLVVLPGFFRPTKRWDTLIMNEGRLIAALEFKSQVGSFVESYDHRTEEAIGTAHCLWTAYRDGALGNQPKPFLGWLMVAEDAPASRSALPNEEPHFKVFPEFHGVSFLKRYDLLCQKMVKEQLYSAAALLATPTDSGESGAYWELSELSGLETFVTGFAAHVAAEAARNGGGKKLG
jgi:type II restriction enzyme